MPPMRIERASVCPLDCPDTCSLTVTVEDEKVVAVRGSTANPYTNGVLCAKVPALYPALVHGPGRLRTPLRRVGARGEGRFERLAWDAALDLIHERFTAIIAAHGPQAILPLNYAGPHGMLAGGSMDLRFFHRLGASLLNRKPLCGGIRTEAWVGTFGPVPGIRPEQVEHARLVIAWGNNVTWSNLHLMPVINQARRRGAKLVVVDPKRTKIAEQADLHVALRPGTDVVLAWAVAAELERRGGIDRAFVERHVEAPRIVHLRHQADIRQRRFVAEAELAAPRLRDDHLLQRREAEVDPVLRPAIHLLVGLVVFSLDVLQHAQILNRMDFAGDDQRHAAHQRLVGRIAGQQRRLRITFFEIFDDGERLSQDFAAVLQRRH